MFSPGGDPVKSFLGLIAFRAFVFLREINLDVAAETLRRPTAVARVTFHAFHVSGDTLHRNDASWADFLLIDQHLQRFHTQIFARCSVDDDLIAVADDVFVRISTSRQQEAVLFVDHVPLFRVRQHF